MNPKIFFSILVFLSSSFAFAKEPSLNWKAIRYLQDRNTFYDGPNCYNATMVAKGWTTIVSQTADEELKYYLWHFCKRINERPIEGDILVQTTGDDKQTEHAAAYLGRGRIFEKLSFLGLLGKFAHSKRIGVYDGNLKRESTYEIRKIKGSDYFKENRLDYRCESLSNIQTKLAVFQNSPEFATLQEAKMLMSKLSFSRTPKARLEFKELPKAIERVSDLLDSLSGETDKDLFLYSNAESINSHFYNLLDGLRIMPKEMYGPNGNMPKLDYEAENNRLQMSMRCLVARIRKARPGPETNYIVRDVIEAAYHSDRICPQRP